MALTPAITLFEIALSFISDPSRDGSFNDSAPTEKFVTHYGVTQTTWAMAQAEGVVTGAFANATQGQCATVLQALYWNTLHCDDFPSGVGLMLFNDAVLCGTGHVASLLARIVGSRAAPTTVIGPDIETRAKTFTPKQLIDAIAKGDDTYFAALANAPLYLRGWTRRETAAQQLAYKLSGIAIPTSSESAQVAKT